MSDDRFRIITREGAQVCQELARREFIRRVGAWSSGAYQLTQQTADKWWPLTAGRP